MFFLSTLFSNKLELFLPSLRPIKKGKVTFLCILTFMGLVTERQNIQPTWPNIWQGRVYTSQHYRVDGPRVTSGKHLQNFNKQIYILLAKQSGYLIRGRSCLQCNIPGYVMWFVVFTEVKWNNVFGCGWFSVEWFCTCLVNRFFGGLCCFHFQVFGDGRLPNYAVS
jgi:hypothetical protein